MAHSREFVLGFCLGLDGAAAAGGPAVDVALTPEQLSVLARPLSAVEKALVASWKVQQQAVQKGTEKTDLTIVRRNSDGGFLSRVKQSMSDNPVEWGVGASIVLIAIVLAIAGADRA